MQPTVAIEQDYAVKILFAGLDAESQVGELLAAGKATQVDITHFANQRLAVSMQVHGSESLEHLRKILNSSASPVLNLEIIKI